VERRSGSCFRTGTGRRRVESTPSLPGQERRFPSMRRGGDRHALCRSPFVENPSWPSIPVAHPRPGNSEDDPFLSSRRPTGFGARFRGNGPGNFDGMDAAHWASSHTEFLRAWQEDPSTVRMPGGEPWGGGPSQNPGVLDRVLRGPRLRGIMCSSSVTTSSTHHPLSRLGNPLARFREVRQGTAALIGSLCGEDKLWVESLNDRSHLQPPGPAGRGAPGTGSQRRRGQGMTMIDERRQSRGQAHPLPDEDGGDWSDGNGDSGLWPSHHSLAHPGDPGQPAGHWFGLDGLPMATDAAPPFITSGSWLS